MRKQTQVVASDIPAHVLQAFESLNYDRMDNMIGKMAMSKLREFCMMQPQKRDNYKAVKIETTIPADVLDMINHVDYGAMSPYAKEKIKEFFTSAAWKALPKK